MLPGREQRQESMELNQSSLGESKSTESQVSISSKPRSPFFLLVVNLSDLHQVQCKAIIKKPSRQYVFGWQRTCLACMRLGFHPNNPKGREAGREGGEEGAVSVA